MKEIEVLMDYTIPSVEFPEEVKISKQLTLEEQPRIIEKNPHKQTKHVAGPSFHEKKDKNKKTHNLCYLHLINKSIDLFTKTMK